MFLNPHGGNWKVAAADAVCDSKRQITARARERAAEQVSTADHARFVEVVETEMMSLHEGNIARCRLLPAECQAWRQDWH